MAEFAFKKAVFQLVITHMRARDAGELAEVVKKVDPSSIFTHLHSKFIEHHPPFPELVNDFSAWAKLELDDPGLSERLANIDIWHTRTIEELREDVVRVSSKNLGHVAHEGEEFVFTKAIPMIFGAGEKVHDVRSFVDALAKVDQSSIFYHFMAARLLYNREENDFSIFLDALGERSLADALRKFDPYDCTDMMHVRDHLLEIFNKGAGQYP